MENTEKTKRAVQQPADVLRKLRAKLVDERRGMAIRLASASHAQTYDHMVALQAAIDATDRAIADEESQSAAAEVLPAPTD